MVTFYMFEKIRRLRAEGLSRAKIAKKLGVNEKTVGKYARLNTPPRYKPRIVSTRPDPFAGFTEKVTGWLTQTPTLNDQEIFELLVNEGYKGSERTINRRLKGIRKLEPGERFFEQKYEPAEQSQFDFKEKVILPFQDGPRLTHWHMSTLPYSDTFWIKAYPFKNFECFMDGVHSFFEEIHGMTANIRFDNLSPCVKKVLRGDERLYTVDFIRAVDYYGFGLLPCGPGKGNHKGDVERDIRTYSHRIKNLISHQGVVFRDWDHLNQWLSEYCRGRQTDSSKLRLIEEQKKLRPLPPREEGILCQVQTGPAGPHGTITYCDSAYSVPDSWIGVLCKTVIGAYDVRISRLGSYLPNANQNLIIHPRKPTKIHSLLLEHILPSLIRKPHALVRWAHRSLLFPSPVCHRFYETLKAKDGYAAEREYLRTLNLIFYSSLPEILVAMELVLENSNENLFDAVRTLLLGERRPASVIDIASRFNQSPLQPELSQYDRFIPQEGKIAK